MLDKKLLALLACPLCKGPLLHRDDELICRADALAFPIRDGMPVMLEGEARALSLDESLPEHNAT